MKKKRKYHRWLLIALAFVLFLFVLTVLLGLFDDGLDDFGNDFLNAAHRGDMEVLTQMLAEGQDPNMRDAYGHTALILAAYEDHVPVVKLLLSHRADVSLKDDTGFTPLHSAAYSGHVATVVFLCSHPLELDEQDKYGFTPLALAASNNDTELVRTLLRAGASPRIQNEQGWQPLHLALRGREKNGGGRVATVRLLLENGVDPDAVNPGGWEDDSNHDSTVSPFAVFFRGPPNRGNTPLEIARSNGYSGCVDILLEKHATK